ncbi:AAA family ATPase [Pseudomonas lini]
MNPANRFSPKASFFLPVSFETATGLAKNGSVDEFISAATPSEVVSILMLMQLEPLAKQNMQTGGLERQFEKVLRQGLASTMQAGASLHAILEVNFSAERLSTGLALMERIGVSLLSNAEVEMRDYLAADGNWDFTFCQRHLERIQLLKKEVVVTSGGVLRLSDQQGRIWDEFKDNIEESVHIQGYPGVGKTHLIGLFFTFLKPKSTLLLALLPAQMQALASRVKSFTGEDSVNAMTFGNLAHELLNIDRTRHGWIITESERVSRSYPVPDTKIAMWLRLLPVSSLQPHQVANICRRTVYAYCHSPSKDIEAKHFPAIGVRLSDADIAVLLHYSKLLWEETIRPSEPVIRLQVLNVHRIKFLSLRHEVIKKQFTHIIIDESHELTAPMVQILDRCPQSIITLGDEFQNLNGRAERHGNFIRSRAVTQSLRAGYQMNEVLNPLIQAHPSTTKDAFEGRAEHPTRIVPYDSMAIPENPTTIIVENLWGMTHWFIHMSSAGANFQIPKGALKDFNTFVGDLIGLYKHGEWPRHRDLFKFGSWDSLLETLGGFHPLQAVHRLLEKGFSINDFNERMGRFCVEGSRRTLARIGDVKNQEFDTVLLSSELLRPVKQYGSNPLGKACARLYTASSRAKHELIVPGRMGDWLKDVSRPGDEASQPSRFDV